jgi:DNA-binding PucR family transcriptional regulator
MISEEALRRALARAGMRSAWHSESGTHLGIVQIGSESPQQVGGVLAMISGVRAGLSSVADGLGATRENVWQAEAALRAIAPGEAGTATIETHLLASIASAALDLAALLSRQVLGPLSALRPAERERILRTVAAYISGGGSVAQTAAELHYHRNTIVNHLRQFERQTGRSLHEPRDLAEIVLALEAERLGA